MTMPDRWAALNAALDAARGRRFEWGRHDCVILAADLVRAWCGRDFAYPWRGRYRTRLGAVRLIRRHGPTLADLVARTLGEPVPWAQARRGDVVMLAVDMAGIEGALGVAFGVDAVFPAPDVGVAFRPVASVAAAWRVPD